MYVTLTIKNVPNQVAERLRQRAKVHHRSLQGELLSIIDQVANEEAMFPEHSMSATAVADSGGGATVTTESGSGEVTTPPAAPRKLTLDELWKRARQLGAGMPAESTDIIRSDRDARGC